MIRYYIIENCALGFFFYKSVTIDETLHGNKHLNSYFQIIIFDIIISFFNSIPQNPKLLKKMLRNAKS